ncbi:MAG: hypothetical protein NTU45_02355 [Planctomycetota bacterium]|nr:hypothetical protein [Planctomycetota bacterium]
MSSRRRIRASRPSRAKRNIRWAAIALLALSFAPSASRDELAPRDGEAIAADAQLADEAPRLAAEGDLDGALDLGSPE